MTRAIAFGCAALTLGANSVAITHAHAAAADSIAVNREPGRAAADSTFESPEPPEDTPAGADYTEDRADSLSSGEVEMSFGCAGAGGSTVRRRQRVILREPGIEAGVRQGRGDALPGAAARVRVAGGWLALGGTSLRWGRGVLVGAEAEPWRSRGLAAEGTGTRARSRETAEYVRPGVLALRIGAGRAAGSAFAGAGIGRGAAGAGALLFRDDRSRAIRPGAALWLSRDALSSEIALDGHGRWRGEAAWIANQRIARVSFAARLGSPTFRAASTARPGPATALSSSLDTRIGPLGAAAQAALWRFRPARTGGRAALEVRALLPQHDALALGIEERHGTRHDREESATRSFRQGVWVGWSGGPPGLALSMRHEQWGRRAPWREPVRRVAVAGIEASPAPGWRIGLTHTVYRVRGGEPQYVGEQDDDRRMLRALSGAGRRTRLEVGFPAAGGEVRAALIITAAGRQPAPHWTLDWTRRARRP